jgi:hypothetical protein
MSDFNSETRVEKLRVRRIKRDKFGAFSSKVSRKKLRRGKETSEKSKRKKQRETQDKTQPPESHCYQQHGHLRRMNRGRKEPEPEISRRRIKLQQYVFRPQPNDRSRDNAIRIACPIKPNGKRNSCDF